MAWLEESSWLPQAKRLEEGQRKYVNHTCGGGKTLVVSADEAGWSGHCFRCSSDGFAAYGIRPLADLSIIKKKEVLYENSKVCELPKDYTREIPAAYRIWLSKNSISPEIADFYGIGWSQALQRIILPVYSDASELIFMQARAVEPWRKPKYLNQGAVPKADVCFQSENGQSTSFRNTSPICCITEDIASCMRVGVYVPGVCFFGTSMSMAQAALVSSRYTKALVWYDNDKAGIKGASNVMRGLRMLGISCLSISTLKDPKLYPNRLIIEALTKGEISGRHRPNYPQDYEGEGVLRKDVYELAAGLFRRKD